jgi:hypothetical protein
VHCTSAWRQNPMHKSVEARPSLEAEPSFAQTHTFNQEHMSFVTDQIRHPQNSHKMKKKHGVKSLTHWQTVQKGLRHRLRWFVQALCILYMSCLQLVSPVADMQQCMTVVQSCGVRPSLGSTCEEGLQWGKEGGAVDAHALGRSLPELGRQQELGGTAGRAEDAAAHAAVVPRPYQRPERVQGSLWGPLSRRGGPEHLKGSVVMVSMLSSRHLSHRRCCCICGSGDGSISAP